MLKNNDQTGKNRDSSRITAVRVLRREICSYCRQQKLIAFIVLDAEGREYYACTKCDKKVVSLPESAQSEVESSATAAVPG